MLELHIKKSFKKDKKKLENISEKIKKIINEVLYVL